MPTTPKPKVFGNIKDWKPWGQGGDEFTDYAIRGEWAPVWKTESEIAQDPIDKKAEELGNPNSPYYKKIGQQIRSQVTGALSPNSILGLTIAMGGSPAQAQEQIKAIQNRVGDITGNLMNQYYLNASGQGINLLGMGLQNAQFGQNMRFQQDMYDQQKKDSMLNNLLGLGGGILGKYLGGL